MYFLYRYPEHQISDVINVASLLCVVSNEVRINRFRNLLSGSVARLRSRAPGLKLGDANRSREFFQSSGTGRSSDNVCS